MSIEMGIKKRGRIAENVAMQIANFSRKFCIVKFLKNKEKPESLEILTEDGGIKTLYATGVEGEVDRKVANLLYHVQQNPRDWVAKNVLAWFHVVQEKLARAEAE
jgi:hypothetical protein